MSNTEEQVRYLPEDQLKHPLLLPKADNEDDLFFCLRADAQNDCSYSIPPREKNETLFDFVLRIFMEEQELEEAEA